MNPVEVPRSHKLNLLEIHTGLLELVLCLKHLNLAIDETVGGYGDRSGRNSSAVGNLPASKEAADDTRCSIGGCIAMYE